jgi:uncharacterized RDD family membrane protein YckC
MELAGLGTRFGALFLDLLALIFLLLVGSLLIAFLVPDDSFKTAFMLIYGFVVWFGYFILFESLWNGQTPGKRAFHLRVIRDGGYPVNFFAVAARNLIRLADFMPLLYVAGSFSVFLSPRYQRLGDMVAGTLVIKEEAVPVLAMVLENAAKVPPGAQVPLGVRNPYDALSPEELELLRRFMVRRWTMTTDDAERLAYRIVVPLIPRLGITFVPGAAPRYADLATLLVAAADAREYEVENAAWAA